MKNIIFIAGLLFVLLSHSSLSQEMIDQYLIEAAKNSPALKARYNEYMAALEVIPQVGSLPDPQVSFGYFISGQQQVHLSASQSFPWFGTLNAKESAAAQSAKVKYEALLQEKSKLYYNIKVVYFELYVTNKALEIIKENIEILESLNKIVLIKIEIGKTSAVDGLRLEMELTDLKNQLALLKDIRLAQTVQFNNLLNTTKDAEIQLPETLWDYDLPYARDAIRDSVIAGNHEISMIDYETKSLSYREEVAARSGNPSFNIGIDYTAMGKSDKEMLTGDNNGQDAIMFPKIGISIPLYRNKYKAMVQEVTYLRKANDEQKIEKINKLESILHDTYKDYGDADRRIELYLRQTELATRALKLLETQYATAEVDFVELLRMERQVLTYRLELEKARADKQTAISYIEYLMGK